MLVRLWRKFNPRVLLLGMYIDIVIMVIMENSVDFSQKIKSRSTT